MITNGNNDLKDYIKTAVKIIFIVVMLFLFLSIVSSCSSKKHVVTDKEEHLVESHDSVINGVSFDRKWWAKYVETVDESDIDISIRIYDTSLPVSIETGTPPLLAEISRKENNTKSVVEKDTATTQLHTKVTIASSDSTEVYISQHEEEKKESDSGISWQFCLFFGVLLSCVIIALWGKHLIQDAVFGLLNKIFR